MIRLFECGWSEKRGTIRARGVGRDRSMIDGGRSRLEAPTARPAIITPPAAGKHTDGSILWDANARAVKKAPDAC